METYKLDYPSRKDFEEAVNPENLRPRDPMIVMIKPSSQYELLYVGRSGDHIQAITRSGRRQAEIDLSSFTLTVR